MKRDPPVQCSGSRKRKMLNSKSNRARRKAYSTLVIDHEEKGTLIQRNRLRRKKYSSSKQLARREQALLNCNWLLSKKGTTHLKFPSIYDTNE